MFRRPDLTSARSLVPFIINIVALGFVTYIPELSLFLLKYMG